MPEIEDKLQQLQDRIREHGSVLVAYSGGVDSSLLLKVATETLGRERALGVICKSDVVSERDLEEALCIAEQHGFNVEVIEYSELADPQFAANSPQRCYLCKRELFEHLASIARKKGLNVVLDGATYSDTTDYRPGMRAAREMNVQSPLLDVHFTKDEIRALAKDLGLANWAKPSEACLASRFPYGTRITRERLAVVGAAEEFLRTLGLHSIRVRYHGDVARIEVAPQDVPHLVQDTTRQHVVAKLKSLGFTYITLDLEGYRSGSLNEPLKGTGDIRPEE